MEIKRDQTAVRARDYLGARQDGTSRLISALREIRRRGGASGLANPRNAREELQQQGVPDRYVFQFCLLAQTDGFSDLLDIHNRPSQARLENFIRNAVRTTGFRRELVMSLTSDITTGLGTAYRLTTRTAPDFLQTRQNSPEAFTIPSEFYLEELDRAHEVFSRWKQMDDRTVEIPPEECERLRRLCAIGIAEAQYYLGSYYILHQTKGEKTTDDPQQGVELLKNAVRSGSPDAGAVLADYYYQKGGKANLANAFELYTSCGASALTPERQENLRDIIERRWSDIYPKMLIPPALMILLSTLILFLTCVSPGGKILTLFYLAAMYLIPWGQGVRRLRARPYTNPFTRRTVIAAAVIIGLYALFRVVFHIIGV